MHGVYLYARTRSRVHRVYVDHGTAYKVEQCNLDDAVYGNLLTEAPEGTRCRYCWEAEDPSAIPAPAGSTKDALAKTSHAVRPAVAAAAVAGSLLIGMVTGVIGSPDLNAPIGPSFEPTPTFDPAAYLVVISQIINDRIELHEHHAHDEGGTTSTPVPTATATPTASLTSSPTDRGTSTPSPRRASPVPSATPVPATPRPSASSAPPTPGPTPSPEPTCFRPGVANGVPDRCAWPPDG